MLPVGALAAGFFGQRGQELQVNVLDAATLRRAQREPAAHGDLVVRADAGQRRPQLRARTLSLGTAEKATQESA